MSYNSQKTREWDLGTANSGLFLNAEFNRIFENFTYFKSEDPEFEGNVTFDGTVTTHNQIISTVIGNEAPLVVTSNKLVEHLNADKIDGADKSIDDTLSGNSDESIPTEKAVKTYADRRLPAGTIVQWPMDTPPEGWLECNGSGDLSRTIYSNLFSAIGVTYGSGDGSTTFNIPDYRGYFLRGWDHGAGNDPDASTRKTVADVEGDYVGTKQNDSFQGHWHMGYHMEIGIAYGGYAGYVLSRESENTDNESGNSMIQEPIADKDNGNPHTSSETRPKNKNVMFVIKY